MHLRLAQIYNSKIMEAVAEFNLITDGDKIMVGLSGGKDSLFLLYALRVLKEHIQPKIKLSALTVDYGFLSSVNLAKLKSYCAELNTELYILKTGILNKIKEDNISNPCARCSYLRKALMADFCQKNEYNKLALGHHYDDAVITFLISMFYSGQLKSLLPKRYLSRKDIYVIRPLIYLRESKINIKQISNNLQPVKNLCPFAANSQRNIIKEKLKFIFNDKKLFYNLVSAMRNSDNQELWPAKISKKETSEKANKLWKNQ